MTNNEAIAAFLAKGGAIKKVATGAKALELTDHEWAKAVRQPGRLNAAQPNHDAEHAAERRHELAHDFAFVGDRQAAVDAASGAFDEEPKQGVNRYRGR